MVVRVLIFSCDGFRLSQPLEQMLPHVRRDTLFNASNVFYNGFGVVGALPKLFRYIALKDWYEVLFQHAMDAAGQIRQGKRSICRTAIGALPSGTFLLYLFG